MTGEGGDFMGAVILSAYLGGLMVFWAFIAMAALDADAFDLPSDEPMSYVKSAGYPVFFIIIILVVCIDWAEDFFTVYDCELPV